MTKTTQTTMLKEMKADLDLIKKCLTGDDLTGGLVNEVRCLKMRVNITERICYGIVGAGIAIFIAYISAKAKGWL